MITNKNSLQRYSERDVDSYYAKKMMMWEAGVFIQSDTTQEDVISSPSTSTDNNNDEMDFSSEEAQLQSQMQAVDIKQDCNFDEG